MDKKNYFEHEISIKYTDGILAQEKDWNWLAEYIEINFNLDDINSWKEFEERNSVLTDVIDIFIRIAKIPECYMELKNSLLAEQYYLAEYFTNKRSFKDICNLINSNYSKILLLLLWITKLENDANNTDYIIDRGIYRYKNFWQLRDCSLIMSEKEEIIAYADTINITGFKEIKSIIYDNIEKIYYETNSEFIEKYKNYLVNYNAFSHQLIKYDSIPWQEIYILDMLNVSIENRELIPFSQFGGISNPDPQRWTKSIIDEIKKYFKNDISIKFILESISYILHKETPSKDIILLHCDLLTNAIKNLDNNKILFCSSFIIISYLFQDKLIKIVKDEENFKKLMLAIHKIKDPEIVEIYKEYYFPISDEQKSMINEFYKAECSKIKTINEIYELDNYLSNKKALKYIEKDDFYNVCEKFYDFVTNNKEYLLIAKLFYKFLIFLFASSSYNSNIEKREVEYQLIKVQKTWQTELYNNILDSLQEKSFTTVFSKEDTKFINDLILKSPLFFIKKNIPTSNEYICSHIENISKYPLQAFITSINIDEFYPTIDQYKNICINSNDKINNYLKEIIENLQGTVGYKFLNQLSPEYYINSLYNEWQLEIRQTVALLNIEKEIYEIIQKASPIKLLEYNSELYLAHITQLFPLLEITIRELAKLIGIFPFKEPIYGILKYKDPSSILIKILEDVYVRTKSFENVSDILMVYNFMYNSTSLNIRNECIHGRKYIQGEPLQFAFKVTLLAIYTIIQRINVIENFMNSDDINNIAN